MVVAVKLSNKIIYLFSISKLQFSRLHFPMVEKGEYFGSKYFSTSFCLVRLNRNCVDVNSFIKESMLSCSQEHKYIYKYIEIYSQMHGNQI